MITNDSPMLSGGGVAWEPSSGAYIEVIDIDVAHDTVEVHIVEPWASSSTTEYMDVDDIYTSNSGTSYYKLVCTEIFYGTEVWWATFTEYYWTDDGYRYVAEDGTDDENHGYDWIHPWATPTYGVKKCPTGKVLLVESGMYSGTLADMDPEESTSVNMVPMSTAHYDSDSAAAIISDGTITDTGNTLSTGTVLNIGLVTSFTIMDDNVTVSGDTFIQMIKLVFRTGSNEQLDIKISQLRLSGGTYYLIDESDTNKIYSKSSMHTHHIYCGFEMQANDIIAVSFTKTQNNQFYMGSYTGASGGMLYRTGVVMGDTLATSWTSHSTYHMSMRLYYFS